jgi:DNA-binding CsgD family transcriptional regulator
MKGSLGRGLGASVAAVAVLNTVSALSMPVRDRAPGVPLVVVWLALLSLHAALYWFGERFRGRYGLSAYAIAQGAAVFALAVARAPMSVALGLCMAFTAELVLLAGARWGATRITITTVALFVVALLIRSDLYQATTAGLALAVTGVIAHAIAGLTRRGPAPFAPASPPEPAVGQNGSSGLSMRETEVLRELVSGAKNGDIAMRLGITERTVKSHLKSIYQKLGVASRSAAVAAAIGRKLV